MGLCVICLASFTENYLWDSFILLHVVLNYLFSLVYRITLWIFYKVFTTLHGHLGGFQFRAIMNKTSVHVRKHVLWWNVFFSLNICLGVRLPRWLSGKESACQYRRCRRCTLRWEDPLEEEIATHSSILAWEIPWTEEPGGLQSLGLQRAGYNLASEYTWMP